MHFQAIPEKIEVALQILVSNVEMKSKQWWTCTTFAIRCLVLSTWQSGQKV